MIVKTVKIVIEIIKVGNWDCYESTNYYKGI